MNVTVARDRAALTGSLNRILRMFVVAAVLLALAIGAVTIVIVRASMRPLRAVRDSAARIGPAQLHLRLPEDRLPPELTPICRCLNELLGRLDEAFARERRFTSDVAHELRTPIAELRSVVEVALRWPDDPRTGQQALREAEQIAGEMQTLVQTLLDLVRASDHAAAVHLEPIPLHEALARAVRAVEAAGTQRDATHIQAEIPSDATVLAERTLLASVLANILSNALEYGDGRETVRCRAQRLDSRWVLTVQNRADQLTPEDVRHMRDPFWRKDSARSNSGSHAGLGLALVDAFCRLMKIGLTAELTDDHRFALHLSFADAHPAPTTDAQPQEDAAGALLVSHGTVNNSSHWA
jgi:two-component system sensor histidine kinase QseC